MNITITLLPCDAITAKAALASDKTSPETCCESLSLSASANKQPDSMIGWGRRTKWMELQQRKVYNSNYRLDVHE